MSKSQVDTKTLNPLKLIRTETALSRYPIHYLAKKGNLNIEITKKDQSGIISFQWEVSYNSKYGQPGPLAYKVDTLVINRRIEEVGKPVPKVIRLGSLREIAAYLIDGHTGNTASIKKSLRQNASAFITTKLKYKTAEGKERFVEADFSRYSIVFTGERLPDGKIADAVYLIINDVYMEILNNAAYRPLDYDYLKILPPGPQRFYEIVSYKIFATLKYKLPCAKLSYSEYCLYAPQIRYFDFDHVKKQMYKIHALHKEYGYLSKITFEEILDDEGKADWIMSYIPGPKAKSEYILFSGKELYPKSSEPVSMPVLQMSDQNNVKKGSEFHSSGEKDLIEKLVTYGITARIAANLVRDYPEIVKCQLEYFPFRVVKRNKAGFLRDSIVGVPSARRRKLGSMLAL